MLSRKEIAITRSSMPPFEEYVEAIRPLWESHWLTNCGENHRQLQSELEEHLGVDHVELFVNGHSALEAALEALDIHGEVITTSFTFVSTVNAIVRKGATPVFVDVEPRWLTIDPEKIEDAISDRTEAILPVHVYGNLCDVDAIQTIADRHGLKVIYDAAHAFGVDKDGCCALLFGDASCLSFHATKVFNTIEGGAVCTGDAELASLVARNRNFGLDALGDCLFPGGNAKMNEFCAAMGLCNLRHVSSELVKRGRAFEAYRERLEGVPGLRMPADQPGVKRNHAYFPVLVDPETFGATRDDVFDALAREGIHARKYFSPAVNGFSWYAGRFAGETPVARTAAERVIALPLYADLIVGDVDRICGIVRGSGGRCG